MQVCRRGDDNSVHFVRNQVFMIGKNFDAFRQRRRLRGAARIGIGDTDEFYRR
jgi:hypothetical protein